MAWAVGAVAAIGVIAGTIQQVQAAEAQAKALSAQARFARQAAEIEAGSIRESAAFQEAQSRRSTEQILGKQLAISAAAGVETTSGSPLFMELDTVRQGEIEALGIRRSGRNLAEARLFEGRFQSAMSKFGARAIRRQIPWMIIGGLTRAAGAGVTGYSAAGGTFGSAPTTGSAPFTSTGST